MKESRKTEHEPGGGTAVAALFDSMEQADLAISELEQTGFHPDQVGLASPERAAKQGGQGPRRSPEGTAVLAGAPTAGFPGWTMGMAPWTIAGVGPVVVYGALSLAHRDDGPDDLRGIVMSLGLHEDVYGELEAGFQRGRILVTVEAGGKEAIASNILDRNGGHSLNRRKGG